MKLEQLRHYLVWAIVLAPCGFAIGLALLRVSEAMR